MSQTEELSRREEQFLENVLENLRQRIGKIAQELEEGQKDIESMHEYYWENYTEMDQYGYEDYDNQQALLHRINANQEKLDLKHRFQKMLDSPFFGRVDFIYEYIRAVSVVFHHALYSADLPLDSVKPVYKLFIFLGGTLFFSL